MHQEKEAESVQWDNIIWNTWLLVVTPDMEYSLEQGLLL